jgi:preprotein translocase subunit Sec61beta
MKKQNVSAPSSSAGLVRFFDLSTGGPKLTPQSVAVGAFAFIFFELLITSLI